MQVEYPFLPVGQVSELLDVPVPTLRDWCNRLEELGIHYLKRNDRQERIFEETDIEIMRFIRNLKKKYGRYTSMEDIGRLIQENEELECRHEIIAPPPREEGTSVSKEVYSSEVLRQVYQDAIVAASAEIVKQTENLLHQYTEQMTEKIADKLKEQEEAMQKELEAHKKFMDQKFEESVRERSQKMDEIINIQLQILQEQKRINEEKNKKRGFWSFLRR
ncbi:MerR family transcriptional regulator [Aneurinibacillus thermoaerophilus]|uniref:MerR family transcriptional regulator n=1 Tax=Aneurinibacillus thermoaerophilus TaxID=143495 RepID=UPI002E24BAEE|nr:MerR family transcriptional regulator [Aneurinibacillus thermoaerophilus]MED0677624.1 MerR family transcriptional regulator [Aneurinibacillus thermoaerophilus]